MLSCIWKLIQFLRLCERWSFHGIPYKSKEITIPTDTASVARGKWCGSPGRMVVLQQGRSPGLSVQKEQCSGDTWICAGLAGECLLCVLSCKGQAGIGNPNCSCCVPSGHLSWHLGEKVLNPRVFFFLWQYSPKGAELYAVSWAAFSRALTSNTWVHKHMLCALVLALHIIFQEHSYTLIRDLSCPARLLISCSWAPAPYKHTQMLAVALALRSTHFLTALTKTP